VTTADFEFCVKKFLWPTNYKLGNLINLDNDIILINNLS